MIITLSLIFLFAALADAAVSSCPVDWDDTDDVVTKLGLQVECAATHIEVSIATCILTEGGYTPMSDVTVNGLSGVTTTCGSLAASTTADKWIGRLNEPFNDCNTVGALSSDETTYSYSNAVALFGFSNTNGDVITRNRHVYLDFTCNYTVKYEDLAPEKNEDHSFDVVQDPQRGDWENVTGEYEYTVQACLDTACTDVVGAGSEVTILDFLNVVVKTTRNITVYILEMRVQSDKTDSPAYSYTIISNTDHCITAAEITDGATLNYDTRGQAIAAYRVFEWASDATVKQFVRVTITFCDPEIQTCKNPCDSDRRRRRRRRGLDHYSESNTVTTFLGPLNVV